MKNYIETRWYSKSPVWWLLPLTILFVLVYRLRRRAYRAGWFRSSKPNVPIIVVGNVTVGGAGKTPLALWLVNFLSTKGFHPGVISRGYGGNYQASAAVLPADPDPVEFGDEPSLIRIRTGVPVVVAGERCLAAEKAVELGCDVLVADDGLQHYALKRDIEIAVVDAKRGLGNGYCLPAGPLRESSQRLHEVDWVVGNGGVTEYSPHTMELVMGCAINVLSGESLDLSSFSRVYAIAGIGNPQRFFDALSEKGLSAAADGFPDHHAYTVDDLKPYLGDTPLLMTEKDAVKCRGLLMNLKGANNVWYVPITARLNPELEAQLEARLSALR